MTRNWGNYPPHTFNEFANDMRNGSRTPGHPWRRPPGEFVPYSLKYGGLSRFHILHSNYALNHNSQPNPVRERHLLLRIDSIVLEPGKKGISPFRAVKHGTGFLFRNGTTKQYLEVSLSKGDEQHSFICRTPLAIDANEPLAVENTLARIHGVHPNQVEFFNPNDASAMQPLGFSPEPKGITMYSTAPYTQSLSPRLHLASLPHLRSPIFKITNVFDIAAGIHHWALMMDPLSELAETLSPARQDLISCREMGEFV